MEKHLSLEDIERYLSDDIDSKPLDWFQEALEHVMSCEKCQRRISKHYRIEQLFEEDGQMLALGLQELAKARPKFSMFSRDTFDKDNNDDNSDDRIIEFRPITRDGTPVDIGKPNNISPIQEPPGGFVAASACVRPPLDVPDEPKLPPEEKKKKSLLDKLFGWIKRKK